MPNTAPYGPAARDKTHIWWQLPGYLYPGEYKSTGQWPPVTGHLTSGQPATDQSPNGQEDISGRPGMPGHRPPLTGHSPTTGQVGDIETSSLTITGHGPSSHWSLDLERLNSGEIQESLTTGHDRSPGSRPPVTGHQNIIQPTSSESHTLGTEFTSKQSSISRILLPLEPDFSNMSDPSVVIEPPGNNWRSDNNNDNYRQIHQTSLSGWRSRRDQSRQT